MARRFLVSGSAKTTAGSVILCASPCYLTGFGLTAVGASGYGAVFDSASNTTPGTEVWILAACPGAPVATARFAPIQLKNGLVLAASGGSAMAAWER